MSSRLDAMMNQYKTNSTSSKKKGSNKFDKNNYFATFLEDGVLSAQRHVRIVEPKGATESPFVEIMGHKSQVEGQWKTFICPKHEKQEACPYCEARELLLATGDAEDKKDAIQFSAKKMYVVKLIDRDNPDHGVKFWRINHHYKQQGVMDKINAGNTTLPEGEDPVSSTNGRDIIITITGDGKKSAVTGVNYAMSQTPLSADSEQGKAWLDSAHEKSWEDVYSVKPYDFLEIIVRGGTPYWQKNDSEKGGGYIDKASLTETSNTDAPKEELDSELSMGVSKANAEATTTSTPESAVPESTTAPESVTAVADAKTDEVEDDDLPF